MANITRIKRKKGTVYKVRVRVAGQSISQTFDKQSDAARWGEDTEKALLAGGFIGDASPGDMAFKTAMDRYLDDVSVHKAINTRQREHTAAKHLHAFFDGQTLSGITPEQVAKFRDMRLQSVKPSTLQKDLALLSHLYTIASTEWSLPISNPVQRIRRPEIGPGRLRMLDEAEITKLLDACKKSQNKKLYHYVVLQLYTGMRPSEGAGLIWGQVDLDRRRINLTKTKNKRSRRVPLTIGAVEILADLMPAEDCAPEDPVFLPAGISLRVQRRPNLFFRRAYDNAVIKAAIKNFTMHDLRHTAASWLIMRGVDIRTLAEILGHQTLQMVQRYTHLLDDHQLRAVDKIDDLVDVGLSS